MKQMDKIYSSTEKDEILRNAFNKLVSKGISSKWAISSRPFTEIREESILLMGDSVFRKDLEDYLRSHQILAHALKMFFTQIAMSARANWYDVPEEIRSITARGWFLGRWIPTFLIIDGPIGRFICMGGSPLFEKLKNQHKTYPFLASARDFLNNSLFMKLRHGFAHWAFDWEIVGNESYIVSYDWKTEILTAKLHQEEADAFHIVAFALIEIIDEIIISRRYSEHIQY
jgi:hypothetical protein